VITDGVNRIWQFEYDNAGADYTELEWSVSGGGAGIVTEQDDFRDGAVFQVRLLDNTDDSTTAEEIDGNLGGIGYISNANTAQSGTTTQLTLAATDDEITGAYVGMKLIITAGAGAGQVGIVSAFTAGTKVATVIKESTGAAGWDHLVPGTAIVAPDASSTYIVEPRATFTSPTRPTSKVKAMWPRCSAPPPKAKPGMLWAIWSFWKSRATPSPACPSAPPVRT
jgi:hypothetical protein